MDKPSATPSACPLPPCVLCTCVPSCTLPSDLIHPFSSSSLFKPVHPLRCCVNTCIKSFLTLWTHIKLIFIWICPKVLWWVTKNDDKLLIPGYTPFATQLCHSPHQEMGCLYLPFDTVLGSVNVFSQWDISKHDASRHLRSICALALPSCCLGNPATSTRWLRLD